MEVTWAPSATQSFSTTDSVDDVARTIKVAPRIASSAEDVAAAHLAYARALEQGRGTAITL